MDALPVNLRLPLHPHVDLCLAGPVTMAMTEGAFGACLRSTRAIPAAVVAPIWALLPATQAASLTPPTRVCAVYDPGLYRTEWRWRADRTSLYRLWVEFSDAVAGWHLQGRYFGYPACCTDQFFSHPHVTQHPLLGTGYIPCTSCAARAPDALCADLAAQRVCPTPFPDDVDDHDPFLMALAIQQGRLTVPLHPP